MIDVAAPKSSRSPRTALRQRWPPPDAVTLGSPMNLGAVIARLDEAGACARPIACSGTDGAPALEDACVATVIGAPGTVAPMITARKVPAITPSTVAAC